jgi:outer membrane protein assembly factor BamA
LLYASLAINGEVYDFGGQVAYINSKHPVNWGVSYSHIPFNYMYYSDTAHVNIEGEDLIKYPLNRIRIFQDEVSVFGVLPITTTQRVEARLSAAHYGFRYDRYNTYRNYEGYYKGEDRERNLPTLPGYKVIQGSTAYTLDNAVFGIASPSRGQRYRIEFAQYFGGMEFMSFLSDYRQYVFVKPVTFAFRFMHLGRYLGENYGPIYYPYFIGYPWYVRGYGDFFFSNFYSDINKANSLTGTRIMVSNVEVRLPFTGPQRLCLIPSKYFYSELATFFDGGLAWYPESKIPLNLNSTSFNGRIPVFSYGLSLRINVFGYMILEPYYAFPAVKNGTKYASFGINFLPGW